MFTMYWIALWFQLNSSDQALLATLSIPTTSKNFLFLSVLCASCLSLLTHCIALQIDNLYILPHLLSEPSLIIVYPCRLQTTNCRLVNLTDVTLAYEDGYSIIVDGLGWFCSLSLVQILRLKFGRVFEAEFWSGFWSWILINLWPTRGEICPCRHCRQQCKMFASGVNFSRNNAI